MSTVTVDARELAVAFRFIRRARRDRLFLRAMNLGEIRAPTSRQTSDRRRGEAGSARHVGQTGMNRAGSPLGRGGARSTQGEED